MSSGNVFADEWRACLREHYMHVIRTRDAITEASLATVMREVGFTESELAELRVRATMHVDDAGADYVPDLNALQTGEPQVFPAALPEADDETEGPIEASDEAPLEADLETEAELADEAHAPPEAVEDEEEGPRQLSLF